MVIKPTRKKKTKKAKAPKGYDSWLEYDLHNNELQEFNYHPEEKIYYAVPSSYSPDFVCQVGSKTILIEVKGRFRTSQEARKYRYVRESLEQGQASEQEEAGQQKELIFLFQDASKPMPFASKRKDGTKNTHGEWATKHGFTFFCLKKGLPKTWLDMI